MPTVLSPYLSFRGNAREAMEFYHSVFGGELAVSTFGDFHASQDPAEETLVMHAQIDIPGGLTLMASDTPQRMEYRPGNNFSISLSGDDEDALRTYYSRLSAGGTVTMPLAPTPWAKAFGMCADKFGTSWIVNIIGAPTQA